MGKHAENTVHTESVSWKPICDLAADMLENRPRGSDRPDLEAFMYLFALHVQVGYMEEMLKMAIGVQPKETQKIYTSDKANAVSIGKKWLVNDFKKKCLS